LSECKKDAYFLDLFEGFTYEEAHESSDAFWVDQFSSTSIEEVEKRLYKFKNIKLIKCNIIKDKFPEVIKKIAVCNIDVDMYDAVLSALNKIAPLIVPGGIIMVEDQGHTPNIAGAYLAIDEFKKTEIGKEFFHWNLLSGQALFVRKEN